MQVNLAQLDSYVERKLITRRIHPSGKLYIFNYTAEVQYTKAWDDVTMMCRGLITDLEGNVVSRPFSKFFNLGEQPVEKFAPIFSISEKLDGSLGVMYELDGQYYIASRGSFTSEQAIKGTAMLHAQLEHPYAKDSIMPGITYLFEIIYPSNRIVVDYGDSEKLVLLAAVQNGNGLDYDLTGHKFASFFDRPRQYLGTDVNELKTAPEIPNAEGYVVLFEDDLRVKFKFDEYKRLHRIITETSSTVVWEIMAVEAVVRYAGMHDIKPTPKQVFGCVKNIDERQVPVIMAKEGEAFRSMLENVPDEFYNWLHKLQTELIAGVDNLIDDAIHIAALATDKRHAITLCAGDKTAQAMVLAYMDKKYLAFYGIAWRAVKPAYSRPFAIDEATA